MIFKSLKELLMLVFCCIILPNRASVYLKCFKWNCTLMRCVKCAHWRQILCHCGRLLEDRVAKLNSRSNKVEDRWGPKTCLRCQSCAGYWATWLAEVPTWSNNGRSLPRFFLQDLPCGTKTLKLKLKSLTWRGLFWRRVWFSSTSHIVRNMDLHPWNSQRYSV